MSRDGRKAHALFRSEEGLVGGALWQRAGGQRRAQVKGGISRDCRGCARGGRLAAVHARDARTASRSPRQRTSRSPRQRRGGHYICASLSVSLSDR